MIETMIVPVLANPTLLYRMIKSIDYPVKHLLVIDNGRCVDPDRITQHMTHIERLTLLPMPSNLGVAGSWNLGIKSTPFSSSWLIVNFDIKWPKGSLERFDLMSKRDELLLSGGSPPWCAFNVGDMVVERVGLFDETLYPAYFEDNDYQRRVAHHSLAVVNSDIAVEHDNSSTLAAGYRESNDRTFSVNHQYYTQKVVREDYTEGRWSLAVRRRLSWD